MRPSPTSRRRDVYAMLTSVLLLAACSVTTEGIAVKGPEWEGFDGADVSLMNTGPYSITASPPFGTVGAKISTQRALEARRLGEYTAGPWQSDASLVSRPPVDSLWDSGLADLWDAARSAGPYSDIGQLRDLDVLPEPIIDAAARRGFVVAFLSLRVARPEQLGDSSRSGLGVMVLLFPDPQSATAAAADMAAADPGPDGGFNPKPVEADFEPHDPDAHATSYDMPSGSTTVNSFAASGRFVLTVFAQSPTDTFLTPGKFVTSALELVHSALADQRRLIADFVPTPADKLADLPLDPSGSLLARTLTTPDDEAPFIIGTWKPAAWLHFEDDPVTAAAMFAEAGVDWVSQRAATVYQTRNADTARTMLKQMSTALAATPWAQPTAAVAGLPAARCFKRSAGATPPGSTPSYMRIGWPVKCVAAVQRWVFTVYAETIPDAHQRISAQYRILAGK